VRQQSVSAYAKALDEAMNDHDHMKRLADNAKRQVTMNYDITGKCREYEDLYASLLSLR
jgi:hypothetical protein